MSRHVLFVHDNRSLGGVGAVSQQLAEGLAQRGWSVDHLQAGRGGWIPALAQLRRSGGVVLATQNFSAAYVAAAVGAMCSRPWVMCVHGPVTEVLAAAPPSRAKLRLLHRVYRSARAVACSSQASLDSLRAFCDGGARGQRVEVIRNTAAPSFFGESASASSPPNRLGFVGRLSPEKQPQLLVHMLRHLPAEFTLEIVGTGPLAPELEHLAAGEIASGRVRLAGLQRVTAQTYRQWGTTLLCSSYEGYPLALLESLASGVPVVSTPIPPAVEMLQARAPYMLAADGSPEALAQAVIGLPARDPAEVTRDVAAIDRDHDPQVFAARWDELLSSVVAA